MYILFQDLDPNNTHSSLLAMLCCIFPILIQNGNAVHLITYKSGFISVVQVN